MARRSGVRCPALPEHLLRPAQVAVEERQRTKTADDISQALTISRAIAATSARVYGAAHCITQDASQELNLWE